MKKKVLLTLALVLSMTQLHAKGKPIGTEPNPIKIGYVNVEYIFASLPETKIVYSELESFRNQINKQLEAKSNELQQKVKAFQEGSEAMTEAVKNKKQQELQQLYGSYEQLQRELQEKLAIKNEDLAGPVQNKVKEAIKQVARKNDYTHILNAGGELLSALLYADEKYDISNLVLTELGIAPAEAKSKK